MELTHFEKSGVNECKLTVTVSAEEFENAMAAAFKKNSKKYQVPGFRKGKAPRSFVEKYYGKAAFYQDGVNESYGEAYEWAADKAGIEPVDRAAIDLLSCDDNGYSFTATVTVKPEVEVKDYKGIKANKIVRAVEDKDVDEEIDRYRERSSRMIDVEGRPAQLGDEAHIDFEGFKDGVPFEGGKGEHYPLTLGSGSFIPGFEEQIVGHEIGDEFDVNVTFPEDYQEESLKGAPALFKCKLHELKYKEVPVADDDLAKDVSDFDTLDELKADVRKHLEEHAEADASSSVENQIVETVIANMTAEVPECMIESRIDDMARDFERRLQQSGLDLKSYLMYTGGDEKTWRDGFRPNAERQVKIRLALEKIAKLEGLEPTEEEFDEEYKKIAESYKMPVDQVKVIVSKHDLGDDLRVEKAMKFVKDNAVVTEGEPETEEKPAKKPAAKKPAAKKAAKKEEPAADEAPADEKPAVEKPAKKTGKSKSPAKEKAE